VRPGTPTGRFGDYDLFVRTNLDVRIQNEIRNAASEAIVSARVRAAGFDRQQIDRLTRVERGPSMTVTDAGESPTSNAFNGVMPMGFALLLMISVMSSGQYLLTTTIEEKSSRTMEVILSAVSPLELLTGKILGQMAVGLTILVIYSSIGIFGLISMAMFGLLDMSLLIYLFIFFLITYVVMGSLMAAIGSAVNELREAQSLMTPITLLLMVPWLFWYPISRDPNSLFATVVSFIPPMNAFAMLLRLTSTAPPPIWQVWLSIVVGVVAAGGALWFASRIFKIGLLMHGRPPDFATLVRWARQA
jgi:ABC-type Na+ efflux pump permease subunit